MFVILLLYEPWGYGIMDNCTLLLNAKANMERVTALMAVCSHLHIDTVSLLLKYGANSKMKNKNKKGQTCEKIMETLVHILWGKMSKSELVMDLMREIRRLLY